MATWTGWQSQLLDAANLPDTTGNRVFLSDWAEHANANCGNNPVDLSRRESGSTNCHKLTGSRTAQRYGSHATAARAFNQQIHGGAFPNLLAAFRSGNPETTTEVPKILGELGRWGSTKFADWLRTQLGLSGGSSGSGGPSSVASTSVYKSWGDLQTSVNRRMPTAVQRVSVSQRRLLQTLIHKRRVRG